MNLQLSHIAYPLRSLGPGLRVGLWLSGCSRRCPGCMSPELQETDAGSTVPVSRLAARLLRLEPTLAGITISGGEPLEQPAALEALLLQLARNRPHWTTIIYSGFCLEELQRKEGAGGVLHMTDVLVDGPYKQHSPQGHPLAGSGNQRVLALSHRGRSMLSEVKEQDAPRLELGFAGSTECWLVGVVSDAERKRTQQALAAGKCG